MNETPLDLSKKIKAVKEALEYLGIGFTPPKDYIERRINAKIAILKGRLRLLRSGSDIVPNCCHISMAEIAEHCESP